MSNSTQKREVLVALDAEFAEKIDKLTDNWNEAIEQALNAHTCILNHRRRIAQAFSGREGSCSRRTRTR